MMNNLLYVDQLHKRLRKVISSRPIKDPKRKELLKFFNSHANRKTR